MSLQTLSFCASKIPTDNCFGAYHDLYSVGSDVSQIGEDFSATVRAYRLDRTLVFERHLNGVSHSRSPARIRRDGFDHLTLHLLLSGEMIAGPVGAERHVRPGEIVVFDNSVPQRSQNRASHTITVSLARDQVGTTIRDARSLHGTILSEHEGGMIADLLRSFTRRYDFLSAETYNQFGHIVGVLLNAALDGSPTDVDVVPGVNKSSRGRRERAEAFIDAHLGDRGLDAGVVAASIGISRTMLYQCFTKDGGVAHFIQQRRLDQIRNALRRRSEVNRLAALAHEYGFSSEQHLSRVFRSAFGQPPGQFRRMMEQLRHEKPPGDRQVGALTGWLVELY